MDAGEDSGCPASRLERLVQWFLAMMTASLLSSWLGGRTDPVTVARGRSLEIGSYRSPFVGSARDTRFPDSSLARSAATACSESPRSVM